MQLVAIVGSCPSKNVFWQLHSNMFILKYLFACITACDVSWNAYIECEKSSDTENQNLTIRASCDNSFTVGTVVILVISKLILSIYLQFFL